MMTGNVWICCKKKRTDTARSLLFLPITTGMVFDVKGKKFLGERAMDGLIRY